MPVYTLQAPDGKTYDIEGPAGATAEQLGAFVTSQASQTKPAPTGNADNASFLRRMGAGAMDTIVGGAQAISHLPNVLLNSINASADPRNTTTQDEHTQGTAQVDRTVRDREAQYQADRTAAGQSGFDAARLMGNVVSTLPIAAVLPGGGAGLLGRVAANAGSSAILGATAPVTSGDFGSEKTKQMALAGLLGGGAPVVGQALKLGKALIDPFSKGGQKTIVGKALNKVSGNYTDDAIDNLQNAKQLVPGSLPTAGQASGNSGIAGLERTVMATDPIAINEMAKRLTAQNDARVGLLQDMAGTPQQRAVLSQNVDETSRNLYGKAFEESIPVTDDLLKLMGRPSMRRVEARAGNLADELSIPMQSTLKDMRPQLLPTDAPITTSGVTVENAPRNIGAGWQESVPPTDLRFSQPSPRPSDANFTLPPVDSVPVRDMHTIKMGMDAMMADPTLGIGGREASAINATRNQFLDMLPPAYQAARESHIALNKPLNQMDIAKLLLDKSTNNLTGRMKPNTFANSLTDDTAKEAIGLKNATLEGMMTPEQMASLKGLRDDLGRANFAETAGKGGGSDTVQKLAYSNMLDASGLPSAIGRLPGAGLVGRGADFLYKRSNDEMRQQLAEALLDPGTTAKLMKGAMPSQQAKALSEMLRRIMPLTAPLAYPAITSGQQ